MAWFCYTYTMSIIERPSPEDFSRSPLYYETDPYENDLANYTGEDFAFTQSFIHYVDALRTQQSEPENLTDTMRTRIQKFETEHGTNPDLLVAADKMREVVGGICNEATWYLPSETSEAERLMFTEPYTSVEKLKPLGRQIEYFIARTLFEEARDNGKDPLQYFIRKADEEHRLYEQGSNSSYYVDSTNDLRVDIRNEIREAYERDIPLYEKVYEAFDELRESSDEKPLEVYLGRDGVYAYHGRRAQAVVRKILENPRERAKLKESGELDELAPRYAYFVFNRPMDNASYASIASQELMKEYIDQAGIAHEENPHFFDTGFVGSIPEAIMRLMGFPSSEVDARIHLLSARNDSRRVHTLVDNSHEIGAIESNQKDELSADGVTIDRATGEIEHVANPTSPATQLHYLVFREIIFRHFWLKEMAQREVAEPSDPEEGQLRDWLQRNRHLGQSGLNIVE